MENINTHLSSPKQNEEFIVPVKIAENTIDKFTLTPRKHHKKPKTHKTYKVYKHIKSIINALINALFHLYWKRSLIFLYYQWLGNICWIPFKNIRRTNIF